MNNDMLVKIRLADASDNNFIFSKWLKNYKFSSRFAKRITNDVYYKWHQLIIGNILRKPSTTVLIAYPKDEPDVNLGFVCFENTCDKIIHYIFVKPEFRKFGIGKSLYKEAMGDNITAYFTHWTYPIDALQPKLVNLIYDPYRI